ncbi:hypothetical protein BCR35DRAFT_307080 [Leucosporidium creatinivorum]|uniref:Myb-like domain-containing protein n=1 Tax=Leucosporidium creatinivorum TaxID=106004 RepID=A0A1Y2EPU9_9BASI|nr:hypothetical protein BCR35DRAFT_307080 [Leucosporidium creatinivorum]
MTLGPRHDIFYESTSSPEPYSFEALSPLSPPAPATPAPRPRATHRRWLAEETELLRELVASGKRSRAPLRSTIHWAPIVEELARRFPPPEGSPARSKNQVQGQWHYIDNLSASRRRASLQPEPNEEKGSLSSNKKRISSEEQPFTREEDAELLALDRIWPGQHKRMARAMLPQRRTKDVRQRLEHLLSLSPSSSTSTVPPPPRHRPHSQPHSASNVDPKNLFQCLRT